MPSKVNHLMISAVMCVSIVGASQTSAQTALPRLSLAFESKTIDASPQSGFHPVAVGPQGHVLIHAEKGSDYRLFLLDSTGTVIHRLGRNGEGPGESRNPFPVYVGPTTVAAWDVGLMRLTEWGTDGTLRRSTTATTPMGVSGRYRDGYYGFTISAEGVKVVRLDPASGATAPLLPPADTFYHAEFKPPTPPTGMMAAPILGEWKGGFVVASTASYRIGLYGHDGRLIRVLGREPRRVMPSRARVERQMEMYQGMSMRGRSLSQDDLEKARKTVEETPLPNFALATPIRSDANDRLWVMGIQGDSAFADIFTPERFVGRIAVSCPGFEGKWSISGRWLAMTCAPKDEEFEGDVVVKLFRVTG
jgi:hypothetical protein